jgi:hypothetical protein
MKFMDRIRQRDPLVYVHPVLTLQGAPSCRVQFFLFGPKCHYLMGGTVTRITRENITLWQNCRSLVTNGFTSYIVLGEHRNPL